MLPCQEVGFVAARELTATRIARLDQVNDTDLSIQVHITLKQRRFNVQPKP